MKNIYLKQFRQKSDSDLERISTNIDGYIQEAREAAMEVLKERKEGNTADKLKTDSIISSTHKSNKKTIPTKAHSIKSYLTDNPSAPELHSKLVITTFSVLFSTVFGAVLLMYNMKRTENSEGRILVLLFGIGYTILIGNLIYEFNLPTFASITANYLGALILTEYFWNKYIGKEFLYRKRSWVKPAIISVLITIPMALLLFL